MRMIRKIAILGDFNPIHATHHALNDSARQVSKYLNQEIQFDWISTDTFDCTVVFKNNLYSGLWIAPGSPYKDMENVLKAIRYTRENNIPTFGNCGGFQHMIIEFAKNVCNIEQADHQETNREAEHLLITKLSCSLKGEQEELEIIDKQSFLYKTLGKENLLVSYYCSYGINNQYLDVLKSNGLSFTAQAGEHMRAFEIKSHVFFVGTLFQPALTSTEENPNPIIVEFVKKSIENKLKPVTYGI
jgi:CTP synthase (UTP-ammonia lyase)